MKLVIATLASLALVTPALACPHMDHDEAPKTADKAKKEEPKAPAKEQEKKNEQKPADTAKTKQDKTEKKPGDKVSLK
jgi:hypothetical protein